MPGKGDISGLAGWVNEPYRQDQVLAALRSLEPPVLIRQLIDETGLPRQVVQRVLGRFVNKGIVTRRKVPITAIGFVGRRPGGAWRRAPVARLTYIYTLVEGR